MHINREANLLGAVAIALSDLIRAKAQTKSGLDATSQAALVAISTFLEGATISELSRLAGLSHSATVRLVGRLVAQGLVQRTEGFDRRAVSLRPTPRGRKVGAEILAERGRALGALLDDIGEPRRAQLTGALEGLLGALVNREADPFRICRMCDAFACGHYEGRCPVTESVGELARAGSGGR